MHVVLITAFGVGGATIAGVIIGFVFKEISFKFSGIVLAFAAGVMLAASIQGLIIPSLEAGGEYSIYICLLGIFCGAGLIIVLDRFVPNIAILVSRKKSSTDKGTMSNKVLLLVLAIAIHNFPEGIAAGVGFGSDNIADAISVALGIALQNIPEGMVIVSPMLAAGISPRMTLLLAALTGVIEIIGTLVGYFAVSFSAAILPFALAFAGGTMLYVISDEIIPESHSNSGGVVSTISLLIGFCIMLTMNFYL